MRKLRIGEFLTVDDVMQAPGLPHEDREGGFQHGEWSANFLRREERALRVHPRRTARGDFARTRNLSHQLQQLRHTRSDNTTSS